MTDDSDDDIQKLTPLPPDAGAGTPNVPATLPTQQTKREIAMNKLLSTAASLIPELIELMSPQLRSVLVEAVGKLEEMAHETSNPIDDFGVGLLKSLLKIEENA